MGVFNRINWYTGGPTAVPGDVRIRWDAEAREQVLADAEEYDLVEVLVDADPDDDRQPRYADR